MLATLVFTEHARLLIDLWNAIQHHLIAFLIKNELGFWEPLIDMNGANGLGHQCHGVLYLRLS